MTTAQSILAEFLDTPTPTNAGAPTATNGTYNQLHSFGNLSSYSMQGIFNSCPRKYQIKKLQAATGTLDSIKSITFSFGHAVGAGVAEYDAVFSDTLSTERALDAAIWATFLAWDSDLLEAETKGTYANGTPKLTGKSFAGAVWAVEKYAAFHETETNLAEYNTVDIEATIAVDFEDGHFYSGHIDELLIHKDTGRYLVKENKTTGLSTVHPALYANSDQALSYAVVVDMLGGTEFEVLYTIYSVGAQEWLQYSFIKSAVQKASWLQDQLLMHQQLDAYSELDFFPMRGANCLAYMRPCEYYGRCELNPTQATGQKFADLSKITCRESFDSIEEVTYYTTLSMIAARQAQKLTNP